MSDHDYTLNDYYKLLATAIGAVLIGISFYMMWLWIVAVAWIAGQL